MMETRRRAYLEAMGLDVWEMKPAAPLADRLVLQPGEGDTLLLCREPEESAQRIAGDISRTLGQEVVWAWPDPEGKEENATLDQAIGQFLFTRVVIFGESLARHVCQGKTPQVIGSARVLVTREVDELAVSGNAKQSFWQLLCQSYVN